MRLHVGTATLRGKIRAYASRFDLLELRAERTKLPRGARLAAMAQEVPAGFAFSMVLPRRVAALESGPEVDQELAWALESARTVRASWLVVQTEPAVMPSARTERLLAALVSKLPHELHLAWDPRGLWEAERAEAVARELGLVLVRDVSRDEAPEGELVYARLRALGRSSLSVTALERAAEEIAGRTEACVVLEGEGVVRAAKTLRELVGELGELSASEAEDFEAQSADDADDREGEGYEDDDEELDGDDEELEDEDEEGDDE